MINIKRILVPTDFSDTSDAALRYAIELARSFRARIHLLHVTEHVSRAADGEYPIGLSETVENRAHDCLGGLLATDGLRDMQPHCAISSGVPADQIVRYAHDHAMDLIVMGTHGREGVARAVLGSVAETVVRRAVCPVLTVHHPECEFVLEEAAVPHVVYATA